MSPNMTEAEETAETEKEEATGEDDEALEEASEEGGALGENYDSAPSTRAPCAVVLRLLLRNKRDQKFDRIRVQYEVSPLHRIGKRDYVCVGAFGVMRSCSKL